MVTAGVFMVCRLSPMFETSDAALAFVTVIGAATCFFAATVGTTQWDIKRVIAYSTCSQLGYMFFAAGVGAFNAAMFHLFTHAFFKALLFLGAGSVIHAMHHEHAHDDCSDGIARDTQGQHGQHGATGIGIVRGLGRHNAFGVTAAELLRIGRTALGLEIGQGGGQGGADGGQYAEC